MGVATCYMPSLQVGARTNAAAGGVLPACSSTLCFLRSLSGMHRVSGRLRQEPPRAQPLRTPYNISFVLSATLIQEQLGSANVYVNMGNRSGQVCQELTMQSN